MQLKRFFAILLAATLIFSVFAVPVSAETTDILKVGVVAETTAPISSNPLVINQGEEVSVKVSVDENTGISFLRFVLYFNADAYEYVSHASTGLFGSASIQVKNGYLIFFVSSNSEIAATGELFTVNFKVKEFCGDTQFTAELANGRESNCCKFGEGSSKTNVPFVAESADVKLHAVDTEAGVVTAPSCEVGGYTTYTCTGCGETVIGNVVSAVGHTAAEAVVENNVDPSCTEGGSYDSVVYCSVCGAELNRETILVDATDHTAAEAVVENNVEASCTEDGSYDSVVYCSVCGDELSRDHIVIIAEGHQFGDVVVYEPTSTSEGYSEKVCQICGHSEKFDFVPALNTTVSGTILSYLVDGDVLVEFFQEGVEGAVYSTTVNGVSGVAVEYSVADVAPGTYTVKVSKDKHATRVYTIEVGAEEVSLDMKICPKGDVTGDGDVTVKDFKMILQHVNESRFLEGYALVCGDLTNDGDCTIKDLSRVLRHVNETSPLF